MRFVLLSIVILLIRLSVAFIIVRNNIPHLNNLDHFLWAYEHHLKNNYIRIHCRTNTDMLGPDPSNLYSCLEYERDRYPVASVLGKIRRGKKIQKTRLREHAPRTITEAQKTKAKKVMAIDYENGWYTK